MQSKNLALVNATGRQAASVARVASALGYHVQAHVHQPSHPVAVELSQLDNVILFHGSLEDRNFLDRLFRGVQRAFINTVSFGDELAIGKSLADAAKQAGVQHYIYSSMPDHSVFDKGWPALPLWSVKFTVENYIRQASHLGRSQHRPDRTDQSVIRIDRPSGDFRLYRHLQQQLHLSAVSLVLHEA